MARSVVIKLAQPQQLRLKLRLKLKLNLRLSLYRLTLSKMNPLRVLNLQQVNLLSMLVQHKTQKSRPQPRKHPKPPMQSHNLKRLKLFNQQPKPQHLVLEARLPLMQQLQPTNLRKLQLSQSPLKQAKLKLPQPKQIKENLQLPQLKQMTLVPLLNLLNHLPLPNLPNLLLLLELQKMLQLILPVTTARMSPKRPNR